MSAAVKIEHSGWSLLNGFEVVTSSSKKGQPLRSHFFYGQPQTAGLSFFTFNTISSGVAIRKGNTILFHAPATNSWCFVPVLAFPRFVALLHYILMFRNAV